MFLFLINDLSIYLSKDFTKRNLNFFKTFTVAFIRSEMVNIVKDPLHFLYIKK